MKTKKTRVLCIGAAHIDFKFIPKSTYIEGTSNPVTVEMNAGGVIRNVAENLAHLNIDVSLASLVGNDVYGNQLLQESQTFFDISHVKQVDNNQTGQYYAVLNQNGNMRVGFANMDIYDQMDASWMMSLLNDASAFDYYVVDLNVQQSGIKVLMSWTKAHQKKLVVIGVSEPKMAHLPKNLDAVYVLVCNRKEALAFLGEDDVSDEEVIRRLRLTGVRHVVLTDGEKPMVYLNPLTIVKQEVSVVPKNDILDTTGAGDAFSAGLIYGLVRENDFSTALLFAATNARLTIKSRDSVRKDLNEEMLIEEAKK